VFKASNDLFNAESAASSTFIQIQNSKIGKFSVKAEVNKYSKPIKIANSVPIKMLLT
jgi:hypothetical protein